MPKTVMSFLLMFSFWLVLVSGEPLEVAVGFAVALLVSVVSREFLFRESPKKFLNPLSWVMFLAYSAALVAEEVKANITTFITIITGNISPAIVRVRTGLKGDTARALLADSITITPGTFTIEIKDDLYVHCLNYDKKSKIGEAFEKSISGMKI